MGSTNDYQILCLITLSILCYVCYISYIAYCNGHHAAKCKVCAMGGHSNYITKTINHWQSWAPNYFRNKYSSTLLRINVALTLSSIQLIGWLVILITSKFMCNVYAYKRRCIIVSNNAYLRNYMADLLYNFA